MREEWYIIGITHKNTLLAGQGRIDFKLHIFENIEEFEDI